MSDSRAMIPQHENIRVPGKWDQQERAFVAQIDRMFTDVYKRFATTGSSSGEDVAPEFAIGTANAAGSYVIYKGELYYLPSGHGAGVSWANTTKELVTVCGELNNLKQRIIDLIDDTAGSGDTANAWSADKLTTEFAKKYVKPGTGIPAADLAYGVVPDISGKADKVENPVNGNLAGINAGGNLVDSGKKPADFALAGDVHSVPSGGNSGYALLKASNTNYDVEWARVPTDAQVATAVQDWCDANITEDPTVVIDATLRIAGAAADAKAAGVANKAIKRGGILSSIDLAHPDGHFYISSDGTTTDSNNWDSYIISEVKGISRIYATLGSSGSSYIGIAFYTSATLSSSTFVSGVAITSGDEISASVPSAAEYAVICNRPASYADASIDVYYSVKRVNSKVNDLKANLATILQYAGTQMTVAFAQGSIASDTGAETSSANRIRSGYLDRNNFSYLSCDDNHKIWFYEYTGTSAATFISANISDTRRSLKNTDLDDDTKYFRVVIVNNTTTTAISPTDNTGFVCYSDLLRQMVANYTDAAKEEVYAQLEKYVNKTASIQFEQGSIRLEDGAETASNNRIRCVGYIDKNSFIYMSCDTAHRIWYFEYGEANVSSYLRGESSATSTRTTLNYTEINSDAKYIRIAIVNADSTTAISPSDVTGYTCIADAIGAAITTGSKDVLKSQLSKYVDKTLSVTFEQGTINSSGEEAANANRIRSVQYIPKDAFYRYTCDGDHRLWLFEFSSKDSSGFLRSYTGTQKTKIEYTDIGEGTKFFRIIIVNADSHTAISPTDETGFVCVADKIGEAIADSVSDVIKESDIMVQTIGAFPRPKFSVPSAITGSDHTIVGNKFVRFTDGSDDLMTTPGYITYRVYGNGFDQEATVGDKWLYHYFGHCNTVDYCEENDCLIFGNGSGSYTLAGKFYIIPNFSSVIENALPYAELTLSSVNAITIDCTSYNLGTKFNVIWGEKNGTINNIAYLITAKYGESTSSPDAGDCGTIRRLLLGMGTNQLTYGQYISGCQSNEFNGTFNILETFTQDGTAYRDCCQGACFVDGEIVTANGHNEMIFWRMNVFDGKIRRKVYKQKVYAANGTAGTNSATGVCTDGKHIYIGVTSVGVWAIDV